MVLTLTETLEGIQCCDERIAEISKLASNFKLKHASILQLVRKELKLMNLTLKLVQMEKQIDEKLNDQIQMLTFTLKLIQIEKQIYKAMSSKANNASLYPLFLSKVDETFQTIYEGIEEDVKKGKRKEGEYLTFCSDSLEHRNFLKRLCDWGALSGFNGFNNI
jgi:hypothetical protein